jgi:hypothetical protein
MRKFHQNIILFSLVLSLVLLIVEVLLNRNIKTHIDLKYEEVYNPKVNADIVILGNSHVAHGINPKYLNVGGYSFYNFGINGSTPHYNYKWYKKVFREEYPRPKYLIYAVDWGMFDSTWAKRDIFLDSRNISLPVFFDLLINDDEIDKKELVRNRFSVLNKPKQLHHVFYKKRKFDFVDMNHYYNGYVPHITQRVNMGGSPKICPTSILFQKDFNDLLDQLKKDSVKVIFVNVPDYIPSWRTEGIASKQNYLDSLAKSRNIPYLKYNQDLKSEMNYDSTYFNNWIHLNDRGAEKFSKMLSKDLQMFLD